MNNAFTYYYIVLVLVKRQSMFVTCQVAGTAEFRHIHRHIWCTIQLCKCGISRPLFDLINLTYMLPYDKHELVVIM